MSAVIYAFSLLRASLSALCILPIKKGMHDKPVYSLVFYAVLSCMTLLSTPTHALNIELDEHNLKVLYLINIIRFSYLPLEPGSDEYINICHLNTSAKFKHALQTLENKKLNGFRLRSIAIKEGRLTDDCHVLYIGKYKHDKLREYLSHLFGKKILTVSANKGFSSSGGMVELANDNQRLKLIINIAVLKQENIRLSAKILGLSTIIDEMEVVE
ncbi:MAG: YfiR family protein [Pseudomonadales bacterium]|nr:YfiR family protein [Pseudomonadales bacterium]